MERELERGELHAGLQLGELTFERFDLDRHALQLLFHGERLLDGGGAGQQRHVRVARAPRVLESDAEVAHGVGHVLAAHVLFHHLAQRVQPLGRGVGARGRYAHGGA
ncbi:MAG TPA: hypothetical protein VG389_08025 [Myxococcota bacterium]|nr:hypothetical protein [Myxococcota bacterium]